MMKSMVTNKATTCCKEQVGVVFGQVGQSIKGDTIHLHKNGSRETQTVEELYPV
jgi:hypothetical protein